MFITRLQYNSSLDPEDILLGAATSDTLCTTAFVFFDFQKALYNDSHIANVMNIDNVVAHFGLDFVFSQFRFDNAAAYRYGGDDDTLYRTIKSSWTNPEGDALGDNGQVATYQADINVQQFEGFAESTVDYDIHGIPDGRSRFIPRAIQELGSGGKVDNLGYNNYSMAMFELYDYQLIETVADDEWYLFEVVMQDYTLNTVNALSSSYADILTGSLKDYYDIAHEVCYYNTTQDTFNDFFVQGITQMFPVEAQAPWAVAPVIYNIHRDILTNEFEGNMHDILDNANDIFAKINPETGTLQQLRGFYTNFQALWDYFYEVDGYIWTQIYLDAEHGVMRLLPGFESPQALTYCNTATDLPDMQVLSDIFALGVLSSVYIMSTWADDAEAIDLKSEDALYTEMAPTPTGVTDRLVELYSEALDYSVVPAALQVAVLNIDSGNTWLSVYTYMDTQISGISTTLSMLSTDTIEHLQELMKEFTMLAYPNVSINGGDLDSITALLADVSSSDALT